MKSPRLNKLRIVFSVNAHVKTRQVLGDTTFDILEAEPTDMLAVFQAIKGVLDQFENRPVFHTREGKPISEKRVEERIRKKPKVISYLEIGGVAVYGNNLPAPRQSFIMVEEKSPGAVSSWDQWVSPFLGWPNFVQAWVKDTEYDHW